MRIGVSIPAPLGSRYAPGVFDGTIGQVVSVILPGGSASATVVSATVLEDGEGAVLTLEVPDEVLAAIADPLGEEE